MRRPMRLPTFSRSVISPQRHGMMINSVHQPSKKEVDIEESEGVASPNYADGDER